MSNKNLTKGEPNFYPTHQSGVTSIVCWYEYVVVTSFLYIFISNPIIFLKKKPRSFGNSV
jgi:hypothetical protein